MKKQHGFTLIELLVVIMILGIISVTAAPKFLNLGSDARASKMEEIKASIDSTKKLVFAKAAATRKLNGLHTIVLDDGSEIIAQDGHTLPNETYVGRLIKTDLTKLQFTLNSSHLYHPGPDYHGTQYHLIIQPTGLDTPPSEEHQDYECATIYHFYFERPSYDESYTITKVYTQHLDKC